VTLEARRTQSSSIDPHESPFVDKDIIRYKCWIADLLCGLLGGADTENCARFAKIVSNRAVKC
jgi:hypothetical protein